MGKDPAEHSVELPFLLRFSILRAEGVCHGVTSMPWTHPASSILSLPRRRQAVVVFGKARKLWAPMNECDKAHLVDGKYGIRDLVDLGQLSRIFERFTNATGFTIGFLDHPGLNVLIGTGWRDICTKFHRGCPVSADNCTRSNRRLLDQLDAPGQLLIEQCDNGLVDCAFPIIIKGKHIASLATGQLLTEKPDLDRFKRQARLFGFDEREYLRALAEVPVISEEKLRSVTTFLGEMALLLSELGYEHLTARETTERLTKEIAEREKLEAQLRQAQKMDSVGRLAGGVAHDFNNMLQVILGHTEMALEQVPSALSIHDDLKEIRKAAEHSRDLTQKLLAFSRMQIIVPKVLDLNETVTSMCAMLQRLIGEDVSLLWHPSAHAWPVKADPSQIDQILVNLSINARDAIPGVGRIIIETGNKTLDAGYCAAHPGAVPGDYVLLSVSDDGCGMDKTTQAHLFEPFFTTKGMGKGTGLGLATVYGIVKQNNGFINVYSEPGKGTTVNIFLVRHVGNAEQAQTEAAAKPVLCGHETILLVEDEPDTLKMATEMLAKQGYTVLAANAPGEAMRLASTYAGEIHLLVTDVVMPEMNGRALAKNLLSIRPKLKCLFMSGYTANVIAHHGVLDEGVLFIQKPFGAKEFAAKVRTVLDAP